METYILFFGKSQSFRFEAYDVNGHVHDFSNVIPDFEDLESRVVVVNKIDNLPIFALYKLRVGSKIYTLFKVYKCAQAFDGNRIEGSICGVAILSEGNLNIDKTNIKNLQVLFKSFNDLAIVNNKFKQADFKLVTDSIWRAFSEQVSFGNISFSNTSILFNSTSTIAIGLNNCNDIIESLFLRSDLNYQRIYFSEDKELLRSSFLRWEDRLQLYFFENGNLELFPKQVVREVHDHQSLSKPVSDESRTKVFELEVSLKQEKKAFQKELSKERGKNKLLIMLVILLFAILIFYFIYNKIYLKEDVIQTPTSSSLIENGIPNELSGTVLDAGANTEIIESYISGKIFQDTSEVKNINSMLMSYLSLARVSNKKDSTKFIKLKKEFFKKVNLVKTLDSLEIETIITKNKN
jgi:hypothetical protein